LRRNRIGIQFGKGFVPDREKQTMNDESLKPVPWHVEFWVAMISNPFISAAIFGLPFSLIAFVIPIHGILIDAVLGWVAGAATFLMVFYRPY
jgi:hypothetical protein